MLNHAMFQDNLNRALVSLAGCREIAILGSENPEMSRDALLLAANTIGAVRDDLNDLMTRIEHEKLEKAVAQDFEKGGHRE